MRKKELDNRWVVPYNPELLMRYNCHINVEVCCSIKSCKYLYKYIHKGCDMASVAVRGDKGDGICVNEVLNYRNARMITAPEACYRMFGFPLYSMSPAVLQLQVHLPGYHMVAFNPKEDISDVVNREKSQKSMLTEFFRTICEHPDAPKYLYREFPEHFRWIKSKKQWVPRKQRIQIGRLVQAHPAKSERYYLRVLLNHVRGPTSYLNLKMYRDVTYDTFRDACEAMGFTETDKTLDVCLAESAEYSMPVSIRRLYALILACCECANARSLYDKYFDATVEDYRRDIDSHRVLEQMLLRDLSDRLAGMGKDI